GKTQLAPIVELTGAPGDQLGAALAAADFDGDGHTDLAIGAPGSGSSGAVYLVWGPIDGGATLPAPAQRGDRAGDRFGAALAVAVLDGSDPFMIAAAPADGDGAIYARRAPAATGDASVQLLARGASGAQLGAALAVVPHPRGDALLLGAPAAGGGAGQALLL